MDSPLPRCPNPLTEKRYRELPEGRIECLKCHHIWKPVLDLPKRKDRLCRNCRCPMYPSPRVDENRCHPICIRGLCVYFVVDWIVCRNTWQVSAEDGKLVWKVVRAVPSTVHDIMIGLQCSRISAVQAINTMMENRFVRRRRQWTKPPEEINLLKPKSYLYQDGIVRKPKHRARRPAFWQYIPLDAALRIFMKRYPDSFEKEEKGQVVLWRPILIRRDKTPVKYSVKILPNTPAQKHQIWERLVLGKTKNPIGIPKGRTPTG